MRCRPASETLDAKMVYNYTNSSEDLVMARQSISLTNPNDRWLKDQVDSEEYASKSEVVNDLIRKAREIEVVRSRLIAAEQSGFTELTQSEILAEIKEKARRNGQL